MRYVQTLILLVAIAVPSWARDLPTDGIQADLAPFEYPYVKLTGKPIRLAPGARIFDAANRIIQPNALPLRAKAVYRLDARGDVQDIWILSADEVAILKKKP
jgi:hypothetical protein